MASDKISSVMVEDRTFAPSEEFASRASVSGPDEARRLKNRADRDPEYFWAKQAEELVWDKPWKKVLTWKHPHAKWFTGGRLNVSVNCLDRHLETWRKNKAAIIWEGEPGEIRTFTYQQLSNEVNLFANVLLDLGIKTGDVVGIYMGMIPEATIAMLACSRIGATHNLVFGGFSAESVAERMNDSDAVAIITQDVSLRKGEKLYLKKAVDEAVKNCPTIKDVIVFRRGDEKTKMMAGRDHWWHELMAAADRWCAPKPLDAEHPLFILYTSGSTGKPKGILHTTGGYLTQTTWTTKHVFDLKDDDIYFCTADIGWITGHSYIVYGPLSNGATVLLYEGAPFFPEKDRFWDMIERHRVTIFYTAPTAIRAFMKCGESWPRKRDLSSLRLLGTVGEPINPEAWMWYRSNVGGNRCPIVDTYWQTETGSIIISPLPGATTCKPGTATKALPGMKMDVVRRDGSTCRANEGGFLVVKHPWPSMLRTIHGDDKRYRDTYWSEFPKTKDHPGWYFTGDGARKDKDGNIWIIGRVDDVVNVSGHRLGTAEIESALVAHAAVAEAAVVTRPDELKGNALVAFVILKDGYTGKGSEALKAELSEQVAREIGHIAKPDEIRFADALPKTRSGKIMRRLLRELVVGGTVSGDVTTLEDLGVLEQLRS